MTLEKNQKSIKNLMDGKMSRQIDARAAIADKFEARAKIFKVIWMTPIGRSQWRQRSRRLAPWTDSWPT